jgi:hypothetical protein
MTDCGIGPLRFQDPGVRLVKESDIPAIVRLFELNYHRDYPNLNVYDGTWVKRCIYSDDTIGLVIEHQGSVAASGAVILSLGDYNDRNGELAQLVVDPGQIGCGLGNRIVRSLIEVAEDCLEFAESHGRTAHPFAQEMLEKSGFAPIGFLPGYVNIKGRESLVPYAKLFADAVRLRGEDPPCVIPEAAPLARHVLAAMALPSELLIDECCHPYPEDAACAIEPMSARSLDALVRIDGGRVSSPLLFGNLCLDQGISFVRRRKATYIVAVDRNREPVGAIGFQLDPNQSLKALELIAERDEVKGFLCRAFLDIAERECGAQVIEVNVSAYAPRLQRTFWNLGFRPAAYAPAMVFHRTRRLDAVRMLKLNIPWKDRDPETKLTERAEIVTQIVEQGFQSSSS